MNNMRNEQILKLNERVAELERDLAAAKQDLVALKDERDTLKLDVNFERCMKDEAEKELATFKAKGVDCPFGALKRGITCAFLGGAREEVDNLREELTIAKQDIKELLGKLTTRGARIKDVLATISPLFDRWKPNEISLHDMIVDWCQECDDFVGVNASPDREYWEFPEKEKEIDTVEEWCGDKSEFRCWFREVIIALGKVRDALNLKTEGKGDEQ